MFHRLSKYSRKGASACIQSLEVFLSGNETQSLFEFILSHVGFGTSTSVPSVPKRICDNSSTSFDWGSADLGGGPDMDEDRHEVGEENVGDSSSSEESNVPVVTVSATFDRFQTFVQLVNKRTIYCDCMLTTASALPFIQELRNNRVWTLQIVGSSFGFWVSNSNYVVGDIRRCCTDSQRVVRYFVQYRKADNKPNELISQDAIDSHLTQQRKSHLWGKHVNRINVGNGILVRGRVCALIFSNVSPSDVDPLFVVVQLSDGTWEDVPFSEFPLKFLIVDHGITGSHVWAMSYLSPKQMRVVGYCTIICRFSSSGLNMSCSCDIASSIRSYQNFIDDAGASDRFSCLHEQYLKEFYSNNNASDVRGLLSLSSPTWELPKLNCSRSTYYVVYSSIHNSVKVVTVSLFQGNRTVSCESRGHSNFSRSTDVVLSSLLGNEHKEHRFCGHVYNLLKFEKFEIISPDLKSISVGHVKWDKRECRYTCSSLSTQRIPSVSSWEVVRCTSRRSAAMEALLEQALETHGRIGFGKIVLRNTVDIIPPLSPDCDCEKKVLWETSELEIGVKCCVRDGSSFPRVGKIVSIADDRLDCNVRFADGTVNNCHAEWIYSRSGFLSSGKKYVIEEQSNFHGAAPNIIYSSRLCCVQKIRALSCINQKCIRTVDGVEFALFRSTHCTTMGYEVGTAFSLMQIEKGMTFSGFCEIMNGIYASAGLKIKFMNETMFREAYFGWLCLQEQNFASQCPVCLENPRVLICDGKSLHFPMKYAKSSMSNAVVQGIGNISIRLGLGVDCDMKDFQMRYNHDGHSEQYKAVFVSQLFSLIHFGSTHASKRRVRVSGVRNVGLIKVKSKEDMVKFFSAESNESCAAFVFFPSAELSFQALLSFGNEGDIVEESIFKPYFFISRVAGLHCRKMISESENMVKCVISVDGVPSKSNGRLSRCFFRLRGVKSTMSAEERKEARRYLQRLCHVVVGKEAKNASDDIKQFEDFNRRVLELTPADAEPFVSFFLQNAINLLFSQDQQHNALQH
jgi:hypothetical protein